jgi:hypothetical protein
MMRIKNFTLGLVAAALLLVATPIAPAGTSLHWTSKAAPGYQHYYRMRGSPSAVCHKRSAVVIHCVHFASPAGADYSVKVRLLSRTRVQYVFRNVTGLNVTKARIPDRSWAA